MKRMSHWSGVVVALAMLLVTLPGTQLVQAAPPTNTEQDTQNAPVMDEEAIKQAIIATEFATFDHLIAHDLEAVDAETGEDILWINSDGEILTREQFLGAVGDMKLQFEQPVREVVDVLVLAPDAAMIVYAIDMKGSYDGEEFTNYEYVTSLWQLRDGRWQNTFLQATHRPDPNAAVAARIANAMSAAPTAIAQDATILDWTEDGMPTVVLREGANDWTCLTDWPASPGNDPQCFDPVWAAWNEAFMAGEEPEVSGPGVAYMLAGGSDPSNTDPFAMEPAEGEDWITTPPHMMLLAPGGFDSAYFTTDHMSGDPYIMWEGTPYEHLMVPVADMPGMDEAPGRTPQE